MQKFCQFEVDFYVINKAVHLNLWIPGEALPTLSHSDQSAYRLLISYCCLFVANFVGFPCTCACGHTDSLQKWR